MKRLTIIVPVYNVEKYIEACLKSFFNQDISEQDFEVILINDGTKDNSMEVVADFIAAHQNIHVINQSNQGLSMTRNNGIKNAEGEYIAFVDSDDLLIKNSLPVVLKEAMRTHADMIIADFLEMDTHTIDNNPVISSQEIHKIQAIEKTGEEMFLEDFNPNDCHVWHTLYKKEFLLDNHLFFCPGINYEDIPFTHECYIKAKKCVKINIPLYIYRKGNTQSITYNINKKNCLSFSSAIAKTWELTKQNELSPSIQSKLNEDIFASFSLLTYSTIHQIPNASDKIEIIKNLKRIAPDMRFKHGLKQRTVTFMYKRLPYSYVYLRTFYANDFETGVRKLKKTIKRFRKRASSRLFH